MFDLSVNQLVAIGVAIAAFAYMSKDTILKTFSKIKKPSLNLEKDDSVAIKELLDFRSRYSKDSLVYSKLTEVIEALLNKDN